MSLGTLAGDGGQHLKHKPSFPAERAYVTTEWKRMQTIKTKQRKMFTKGIAGGTQTAKEWIPPNVHVQETG